MTTDYSEMARKIADDLLEQHNPINPYIAEVDIEKALRKVRQETLDEVIKEISSLKIAAIIDLHDVPEELAQDRGEHHNESLDKVIEAIRALGEKQA